LIRAAALATVIAVMPTRLAAVQVGGEALSAASSNDPKVCTSTQANSTRRA